MLRRWPEEEDRGYRRGFDQGVAALAYALGLKNRDLQDLTWKKRVTDFRHYRLEEAPCWPTDEEKAELRQVFGEIQDWG